MNAVIARIHAIGQMAWLKFLSNLNALIGVACLGVIMLNQTNPQIVATLTARLTPTQQAVASFAFCCLVQYALRRAKKLSE